MGEIYFFPFLPPPFFFLRLEIFSISLSCDVGSVPLLLLALPSKSYLSFFRIFWDFPFSSFFEEVCRVVGIIVCFPFFLFSDIPHHYKET